MLEAKARSKSINALGEQAVETADVPDPARIANLVARWFIARGRGRQFRVEIRVRF